MLEDAEEDVLALLVPGQPPRPLLEEPLHPSEGGEVRELQPA